MPSSWALWASMGPGIASPIAYPPGTLVSKRWFPATRPRSSSAMPASRAPRPSTYGRRPIATSTTSVSPTDVWPFDSSVARTPRSVRSARVAEVSRRKARPCFSSARRSCVPMPRSMVGTMASRNSTTVTLAPSRLHTDPSSSPTAPAPMTSRRSGTRASVSASVELTMRSPSKGRPRSGVGSLPGAVSTRSASRRRSPPTTPLPLSGRPAPPPPPTLFFFEKPPPPPRGPRPAFSLPAVHQAVVVGDRHVHHRPDGDRVLAPHRPLLDLVHAEDGALRRVQDGGGEERAVDAAVGDGEGAAGEVVELELAVAREARQPRDLALDVRERHALGVVEHGNDEAALRPHRHPEVNELLVDDVVAADLGVDHRDVAQRRDAGAREERHEAEPDAVLLLEALLVLGAQRDHRAHIDLVEGGEDGGGSLRLDEALGDPPPDRAQRHPLLALGEGGGRLRRRRHVDPDGPRAALEVRQHVLLGEPPALAGSRHQGRIEIVLGEETADGRAERSHAARGDGLRLGLGGGARGPGAGRGRVCGSRRPGGRASGCVRGRARRPSPLAAPPPPPHPRPLPPRPPDA